LILCYNLQTSHINGCLIILAKWVKKLSPSFRRRREHIEGFEEREKGKMMKEEVRGDDGGDCGGGDGGCRRWREEMREWVAVWVVERR